MKNWLNKKKQNKRERISNQFSKWCARYLFIFFFFSRISIEDPWKQKVAAARLSFWKKKKKANKKYYEKRGRAFDMFSLFAHHRVIIIFIFVCCCCCCCCLFWYCFDVSLSSLLSIKHTFFLMLFGSIGPHTPTDIPFWYFLGLLHCVSWIKRVGSNGGGPELWVK